MDVEWEGAGPRLNLRCCWGLRGPRTHCEGHWRLRTRAPSFLSGSVLQSEAESVRSHCPAAFCLCREAEETGEEKRQGRAGGSGPREQLFWTELVSLSLETTTISVLELNSFHISGDSTSYSGPFTQLTLPKPPQRR